MTSFICNFVAKLSVMIYSQTFFNSANESNPEGELAVSVLISNIIEIATAHANFLGIGNPSMSHLGAGWVLSRLKLEMTTYPRCNTSYKLFTWVENWNRHFSTRDFRIEDSHGNILGYARSVWMVLDTTTHENYGLSHLTLPEEAISEEKCPLTPQSKHIKIMPYSSTESEIVNKAIKANLPDNTYTFKYSDVDFYRHVNTVRYISILLNQFSLETFDKNFIRCIEISFLHEGKYGEEITIRHHKKDNGESIISLYSDESDHPILYTKLDLNRR